MEIKSVSDASGLEELIQTGRMAADSVVAVIGKTEGNGGVNDFTRILSDTAFRGVLMKHGTRSEAAVGEIPMVWSGGCDGVLTPHATVFARNDESGPADEARLAMGTAMSAPILPEDIGRPAMVAKIAEGVRAAMADAGIDDPTNVHYVQTKTPLLTIDTVQEAQTSESESRWPARCTNRWGSPTAPPGSASPWRWARSPCPRRTRSAATSTSTPRSPRAPPASSSSAGRSSSSATPPARAGASASATA